ncbi:MAG: hypothetical protein AAB491_02905 [Patescibacteria group bacterium]
MTLRKRRVILIICIIVLIIIIPAVILYNYGYRINSKFQIVQTGGLYIWSPVRDAKIIIDNKEKSFGIFNKDVLLQSLMPKTYSVAVIKEGYWPWFKNLEVKERLVTEARSFLVPINPNGEIIPLEQSNVDQNADIMKEFKKIINIPKKFKNEEEKKLFFSRFTKDEKGRLWWEPEKNEVRIEWLGKEDTIPYYFCLETGKCNMDTVIINTISAIRNVDFYPGRKDVIIMASQNGVFAVEIDGRGNRNVQPIYKGKEPSFITYKDMNPIYILDDNNLIKINLEL